MTPLRQSLRKAAGTPLALLPPKSGWEVTYCLPADSLVFVGHFPDHPVLPAVAQIAMAQMLLEQGLGCPCLLVGVPQAKFTAPVGPDTPVTVRVEQGRKPGDWLCVLDVQGQSVSRFSLKV